MSNPLTPSFRRVHRIPKEAAHDTVRQFARDTDQSVTDINQAIGELKSQIDTIVAKAAATTINQNTTTGGGSSNFVTLGTVNDQFGVTSYTTQQSDNGAKIVLGDSSSVSLTLNPTVAIPWFTIIGNDSTSGVTLSAASPATLYGVQKIYPGGFVLVYYDGSQFWSEGVVIAQDSTLGVIKPDAVCVEVAVDGTLYTKVQVGGGSPSGVPATPGNPLYFDSTVSPWHGWVYALGGWNQFS